MEIPSTPSDAVAVVPLPQKEEQLIHDVVSTKSIDSTAIPIEQLSPADLPTKSTSFNSPVSPERVNQTVGEIKELLAPPSPSKIPVRKAAPVPQCGDLSLDILPPPAPEDATKRKSMSPSQKEDLANRLYSKAMELKEKRDNLFRQPKEECTFKPTINRTPSKREEVDKDIFLTLHDQAEEMARRKEELKQSVEAQFTYKPEISNLSRRISARHDAEVKPSISRSEELYKKHQEMELKREEKKKELEKKDSIECTFQPKIKKVKGKSPPKQPLYDAELQKQKKLEKERRKAELELAECSFKPQMSKGKVEVKKSFFDRLEEADKKRVERMEVLRKEKESRLEAEMTFRPVINDTKSHKQKEKVPFHERLFNKEVIAAQVLEREQKKIELESQVCTFKPEIREVPVGLERRGSIFDRLYEEQKKKQEMLDIAEQEKLRKEMEECTFKPMVLVDPNVILKEIPTEPVWERLSNDKKQILEEREKLKEEMEQKDCTFKPNIQGTLELGRRPSMRRPSSPELQRSPSKINIINPSDASNENESCINENESKTILDNYETWAASLEEKMIELK